MPRFLSLARSVAVVAAPLAAALLPGQALPGQEGQLAQASQEVGGFSEATLKAYAAAVLRVQDVDAAWEPRLQEAETPEEVETLTRQATDEMIGEIEAQGLSVEQYNAITQAADRDARLYDRIMTLLAQAR